MGLILEDKKYAILSDILGDEDFLGDMDFKVAGTKLGVTALQMDIKVAGISIAIIKDALAQAQEGRMHILDIMNKTIESSNEKLSLYAPAIDQIKIDKEKIRDLIGPGGKIIKELCEKTSSKIDINDDGIVTIAAPNSKALENAKNMVMNIVFEPKVGDVFEGIVVKIIEHGAFVNYIGSRDGFLHISEISDQKVVNISDHLKVNQKTQVKVIGFDNRGKVRLSLKQNSDLIIEPKKKELPVAREKTFKPDHKVSRVEAVEQEKTPEEPFSEKKYFD
jgi:polyribonucleotide nucleotidyltransferase